MKDVESRIEVFIEFKGRLAKDNVLRNLVQLKVTGTRLDSIFVVDGFEKV